MGRTEDEHELPRESVRFDLRPRDGGLGVLFQMQLQHLLLPGLRRQPPEQRRERIGKVVAREADLRRARWEEGIGKAALLLR